MTEGSTTIRARLVLAAALIIGLMASPMLGIADATERKVATRTVDAVRTELADAETRLSTKTAELAATRTAIATAEDSVATKTATLTALDADLATRSVDLDAAKALVADATLTLDAVSAERDGADALVASSRTALEAHDADVVAKEAELASLATTADVDAATALVAKLSASQSTALEQARLAHLDVDAALSEKALADAQLTKLVAAAPTAEEVAAADLAVATTEADWMTAQAACDASATTSKTTETLKRRVATTSTACDDAAAAKVAFDAAVADREAMTPTLTAVEDAKLVLAEKEALVATASEALTAKTAELDRINALLASAEADVVTKTAELDRRAALSKQLTALATTRTALVADVESAEAAALAPREKFLVAERELQQLVADRDLVAAAVADLETNKVALVAAIDADQKSVVTLTEQVRMIEGTKLLLEKEVAGLRSELAALEAAIPRTAVVRTIEVGDGVADLGRIDAANPITAVRTDGALPSGIAEGEAGAFVGSTDTVQSTVATFEITDTANGAKEIRTVTMNVVERTPVETTRSWSGQLGDLVSLSLTDRTSVTAEVNEGTIPIGFALATDPAQIDGTPAEAGTWAFKVMVRDTVTFERELVSVSLTAIERTPVETTRSWSGQLGDLVSLSLTDRSLVTAEVVEGSVPAGFALSTDGRALDGAPSVAGETVFKVMVRDAVTFERELVTVTVSAAERTPTESTRSWSGRIGDALTIGVTTNTNAGVELVDGVLPAGVGFSADGRTVEGVPTEAGSTSAKVMVRDAVTFQRELVTLVFVIEEKVPVPVDKAVTTEFGSRLTALAPINDGNEIVAELISGELPQGVTMTASGDFEGVPAEPGTYEFTVLVTDLVTRDREMRSFEIVVAPARAVTFDIASESRQRLVVGDSAAPIRAQYLTRTVSADLVAGSLPTGLTLQSTGNLIGVANAAGSYEAVVELEDLSTGDIERQNVYIEVASVMDVELTGQVGQLLDALPDLVDGSRIGVEFHSGSVPEGVELRSDGTFVGEPTEAGTWTFEAFAIDSSNGLIALQRVTVTIGEGVAGNANGAGAVGGDAAPAAGDGSIFGPSPDNLAFVDGSGGGSLAHTGTDTGTVAGGGVALIVVGYALTRAAGRRRSLTSERNS